MDFVLVVDGTFFTIPTVGILRVKIFLFPPEPYSSEAVNNIELLRSMLANCCMRRCMGRAPWRP